MYHCGDFRVHVGVWDLRFSSLQASRVFLWLVVGTLYGIWNATVGAPKLEQYSMEMISIIVSATCSDVYTTPRNQVGLLVSVDSFIIELPKQQS